MTLKNTMITTSFLLAMGASLPGFAETKAEMVDGDTVSIECVVAADVAAMTAEDKAKLTLPVCEDTLKNAAEDTTTQ